MNKSCFVRNYITELFCKFLNIDYTKIECKKLEINVKKYKLIFDEPIIENLTETETSFKSELKFTSTSNNSALGSYFAIAVLIFSFISVSDVSPVDNSNSRLFKFAPKDALKGLSKLFVKSKFLIDCLTAAASFFLKTSPVPLFFSNVKSMSLYALAIDVCKLTFCRSLSSFDNIFLVDIIR